MKNKNKNKNKELSQKNKQESKTLLVFLKRTKKGDYAEIEKSSLRYSRVSDDVESLTPEEEFFYSLS